MLNFLSSCLAIPEVLVLTEGKEYLYLGQPLSFQEDGGLTCRDLLYSLEMWP